MSLCYSSPVGVLQTHICFCVFVTIKNSRPQAKSCLVVPMLSTHLIHFCYFCCWAINKQMNKRNEWMKCWCNISFFIYFKWFIQFVHLNNLGYIRKIFTGNSSSTSPYLSSGSHINSYFILAVWKYHGFSSYLCIWSVVSWDRKHKHADVCEQLYLAHLWADPELRKWFGLLALFNTLSNHKSKTATNKEIHTMEHKPNQPQKPGKPPPINFLSRENYTEQSPVQTLTSCTILTLSLYLRLLFEARFLSNSHW